MRFFLATPTFRNDSTKTVQLLHGGKVVDFSFAFSGDGISNLAEEIPRNSRIIEILRSIFKRPANKNNTSAFQFVRLDGSGLISSVGL